MQYEALEQYTPSDKEVYMNHRQLQYFRERLLMELEALNTMTAQNRTQVQNIHSESADAGDLSFTETKMTMQLNKLNHCQKKLRQVLLALERIDKGRFGYCLLTGDKIGIKRLKALPWATLAIETQEMFEAAPQQTRCLDYRFSFSNRHNGFSTNDIHIKDFDYERDKTILSEDLGITCR